MAHKTGLGQGVQGILEEWDGSKGPYNLWEPLADLVDIPFGYNWVGGGGGGEGRWVKFRSVGAPGNCKEQFWRGGVGSKVFTY